MSTNTLPSAVAAPLMPFEQQVRLAEAFAKSGLFGVKSSDQALTLMALCEAEGLHPATAVRDYHIINGRPAMKAEAMLARFLRNGGKVEWHERTDKVAEATFSHPAGGKVRVKWDLLMAKVAGLAGKEMYQKYPRQLLHARCVSEGVRSVDPQATGHQYTPEEVQDIPGQIINGEAEDTTRRDKYVQMFRDLLDQGIIDEEYDYTAKAMYTLQNSLHGEPDYIELNKSIWTQIHSTDRASIKRYVKRGKELLNGEPKGPREDRVPPLVSPDNSDFIKEYEEGRA